MHLQTELLTILLITVTLLVADYLMPGLEQEADSLEMLGKKTLIQGISLLRVLYYVQGGVERVSNQLTSLFDELVWSRKKLMDASQYPCGIHRTYTW